MGLFSHNKKESKNQMPPAPPVAPMAPPQRIEPPKPAVQSLSSPPIPGGTLDDIKMQVSSPKPISSIQDDSQKASMPSFQKEELHDSNDSLFDFSELDLETPTMGSNENFSLNNNNKEKNIDKESINFIHNSIKDKKVHTGETYFVTTKQFKTLLEIIESVKGKVKEASETHLKLLDIKAEEDVEYEKLRKDFQYIEDKLHEVDSIIFDN